MHNNYPSAVFMRIYRFLLPVIVLLAMAFSLGGIPFVYGNEVPVVSYAINQDNQIIEWEDHSIIISIPKNSLTTACTLEIRRITNSEVQGDFPPPPRQRYASDFFIYDIKNCAFENPKAVKVELSFPVNASSEEPGIYSFNVDKQAWQLLQSKKTKQGVTTTVSFIHGEFALFERVPWIENNVVDINLMPAKAAYVVDDKGAVLLSKEAEQAYPIASITKLMTALVFLDYNPGWNKVITIKKEDDAPPAKLEVKEGDTMRVKDIFSAMLVGSKNNAANTLARATGLSREAFIIKMNERAQKLGMTQTVFFDVSGLDFHNVSSPKDIAALATQVWTKSAIRDALSARAYRVSYVNKKQTQLISNTNTLFKTLPSVLWGKTGYIDESGFNFVTTAQYKGRTLTVVIFGSPTSEKRFTVVRTLIEKGLLSDVLKVKIAGFP